MSGWVCGWNTGERPERPPDCDIYGMAIRPYNITFTAWCFETVTSGGAQHPIFQNGCLVLALPWRFYCQLYSCQFLYTFWQSILHDGTILKLWAIEWRERWSDYLIQWILQFSERWETSESVPLVLSILTSSAPTCLLFLDWKKVCKVGTNCSEIVKVP